MIKVADEDGLKNLIPDDEILRYDTSTWNISDGYRATFQSDAMRRNSSITLDDENLGLLMTMAVSQWMQDEEDRKTAYNLEAYQVERRPSAEKKHGSLKSIFKRFSS